MSASVSVYISFMVNEWLVVLYTVIGFCNAGLEQMPKLTDFTEVWILIAICFCGMGISTVIYIFTADEDITGSNSPSISLGKSICFMNTVLFWRIGSNAGQSVNMDFEYPLCRSLAGCLSDFCFLVGLGSRLHGLGFITGSIHWNWFTDSTLTERELIVHPCSQ